MANDLITVSYKLSNGAMFTIDTATARAHLTANPKTTNQEIALFLKLCESEGLDPYRKEAYIIKYGDNAAQMVIAFAVFNRRAKASPRYEGEEDGITVINRQDQIEHRNGELLLPDEQLIGGWCRVYVKGLRVPKYVEVNFSEYNQSQALWKSKPATMIHKVAMAHAYRNAFPEVVGGLYIEDEMQENVGNTVTDGNTEPIVHFIPRAELGYMTRNVDKKDKVAVARVSDILKQHGATSLDTVPLSAKEKLVKAIDDEFPDPSAPRSTVEVESIPVEEPAPVVQPKPVHSDKDKSGRLHKDEKPITFGKHKGLKLCEISDEYLTWVVEKMEIKDDQYAAANRERNRIIAEYLGMVDPMTDDREEEYPDSYEPENNDDLPFPLDR